LLGRMLVPGVNLLSPRGPVVEDGARLRWFRRLDEGVFDTEDLATRAAELAGFVERAAEVYDLDPSRFVVVGFSNGANIAAGMLLLGHSVVRGAVLLASMIPLEPDERPDLSTVGIFMSSGRRDPLCPPEQAEELARLLTDAGAAVELHWHDGGHTLPREHVGRASSWLRKLFAATAADPGASPP
jgi:phospholipase/carboxylesterase